MSKVDVLLGTAWGDEAKAKFVDFLSQKYDAVIRFQGGANAGHTVVFDGKKYILHTIPSGIFHENVINIIGRNVLVDPVLLLNELKDLYKSNINTKDKLLISESCQLVLPTHKLLDIFYEKKLNIGTTKKGIGSCYSDKALRIGVNLLNATKENINVVINTHLDILGITMNDELNTEIEHFYENLLFIINNYQIVDDYTIINQLLAENKKILAEGAQGSLLDISGFGYPYVTSSNTNISGVLSGLSINHNQIGKVYGIAKAYITRVGNGDMPTEIRDTELATTIQKVGNEIGATTGRQRRVGYLDLPLLRYSVNINGITDLVITKLDVLTGISDIRVAHSYNYKHTQLLLPRNDFNYDSINYTTFEGWDYVLDDEGNIHPNIKIFIDYIMAEVNTKVTYISTSPDRKDIHEYIW